MGRRSNRSQRSCRSCRTISRGSWRSRPSRNPTSRSTLGPRFSKRTSRSSGCCVMWAWRNSARSSSPDTAPVLTGEIPDPDGAPTVLLYGHYDVVPAGDEEKWESPPFEATERDGAIYGRGAADSKSNILVHVGALRAWDGKPPVGIKILIEGQEEVGSPLDDLPAELARLFAADAMLVADGGNIRPGVPSLTVGLRGDAVVTVEVRTLAEREAQRPVRRCRSRRSDHAAARARLAPRRARRRRCRGPAPRRVEGRFVDRRRVPRAGRDRARAAVPRHRSARRPRLVGRRRSPITGIDVPSVDEAINAVSPYARAKLNLRVAPRAGRRGGAGGGDRHLESCDRSGSRCGRGRGDRQRVRRGHRRAGLSGGSRGLRGRLGQRTAAIATGGSIPLVRR